MINMTLKHAVCTALLLACTVFAAGSVMANEPSSVTLSYDTSSRSLRVIVGHYSFDTTVDYISSVEIAINSKPYMAYNYSRQYDKTTAVFNYQIDANPGDVISVTAISTGTGSKTATITVEN